jgi:hypothetical protein
VFDLPDDFEPLANKINDSEKKIKYLMDKSEKIQLQINTINKGVDELLEFKKQALLERKDSTELIFN